MEIVGMKLNNMETELGTMEIRQEMMERHLNDVESQLAGMGMKMGEQKEMQEMRQQIQQVVTRLEKHEVKDIH